ncbi:NAD-dependent deacetylase sirtuin-2 [Wolfiporia cocos MD-104 SS10]|uniref:NAD-dependent protein deacetylase n=1 Tax=Wolfiporia cocos (strain MD-104) TaxID=742152 RepID=A0A2H3JCZ6_WOLCO|nr:NAD-dependent deacetylase sirtuin-2 [Wolfiporia cocos MD-104 SS10]
MGAEQSKGPYEGSPEVLEARDLPSVAKYMKSPECRKVFVMLGAGASTSAGIPDFRSPEIGMSACCLTQSNLARFDLTHPEAIFEINFFRQNPKPFYALARELLPGRFRPTPTHSFVKLLHDHSLLHTCFTQNIDTLERRAGVPDHKIVEAHGSFANQRCVECRAEYDAVKMRECLKTGTIANCNQCGGLVKPDITFFGESLPEPFHRAVPFLRGADILFVIGTSLQVQPFASLPSLVPEHCPRVLINLEDVGDFGSRSDDVIILDKCDNVVRALAKELGWEEEFDAAWQETENSLDPDEEIPSVVRSGQRNKTEEQQLKDDVEEISEAIAQVAIEPKSDEPADAAPDDQTPVVTGAEEPVLDDKPQSAEEVTKEKL